MLNRKVLVLNQNYEPLTICKAKRAIIMMLLGKAELIVGLSQSIRSVRRSFPLPSVLRLNRYVKFRKREITLTRRKIIERDRHQCQYCGRTTGPMTADHVVPKSMGGKDTWENMVCACLECNNRKGDRLPEQAGMKLIRKPRRPHHLTFILNSLGRIDAQWRPFLYYYS
ncbi:HNH endonuclease [candidate division WOR-3 bacterium]|uniref:HNH endonuclease n=1 Tax=candidate division WOR-3 bacterium TaxID=2052148 RepID=A0A660SIS9_UNCW3|nr:MAG: HNH endonuclease [candidate division WOR-3 bacterium]